MGLKSWAKGLVVKVAVKKAEREFPMLAKVWAFLNGKKTAIGAVLTIAAEVLDKVGPLAGGTPMAKYIGLGLMGIGLIHKAWKWLAELTDLDPLDPPGAAVLIPLLIGALSFVACGGTDIVKPDPSAPDVTVSPPSPDMKCVPDSGLIQAAKASRPAVPVYAWVVGQQVILSAKLFTASGEPVAADCGASLKTSWRIFGAAYCTTYGSIETPEVRVECQGGGDVQVDATRAGIEATAVFKVVSSEAEAAALNRAWRLR